MGAGTVPVEAENACWHDVAVVEVTQEYCGCDMWVPTAFTPDNDGINDGFKVETNCPELDEFTLQVFDRWGELVWATDDPERTWMGEGQNPLDGWPSLRSRRHLRVPPDLEISATLAIPRIEERQRSIHILSLSTAPPLNARHTGHVIFAAATTDPA